MDKDISLYCQVVGRIQTHIDVEIDYARIDRICAETKQRYGRLSRSKRKAERQRFNRRIVSCITVTRKRGFTSFSPV